MKKTPPLNIFLVQKQKHLHLSKMFATYGRLLVLVFIFITKSGLLHAQYQPGNIGLYEQSGANERADQAYAAWQSGAFRSYPEANFNLGRTSNLYWLHFSIATKHFEGVFHPPHATFVLATFDTHNI